MFKGWYAIKPNQTKPNIFVQQGIYLFTNKLCMFCFSTNLFIYEKIIFFLIRRTVFIILWHISSTWQFQKPILNLFWHCFWTDATHCLLLWSGWVSPHGNINLSYQVNFFYFVPLLYTNSHGTRCVYFYLLQCIYVFFLSVIFACILYQY